MIKRQSGSETQVGGIRTPWRASGSSSAGGAEVAAREPYRAAALPIAPLRYVETGIGGPPGSLRYVETGIGGALAERRPRTAER